MKTSFITLTNKGYLPYTFNCLESLKKIGITELRCYAIGRDAYQQITRKKFPAEQIDDEENTGFQVFRSGNWANVTFYKFEIIYDNLKTSDFVCFTDGDIVFKNPEVFAYCRAVIGQNDLLIQNDTMDDHSEQNLCSGFMFIRSNENTLNYFNPQNVKKNSSITEGWDDQVYINQIKENLNFKLLPLSLFPNGKYFLKNHRHLTPYLIHFNWLIGHKKSDRIIGFGECYSTALWYMHIRRKIRYGIRTAVRRVLSWPLRLTGRAAN